MNFNLKLILSLLFGIIIGGIGVYAFSVYVVFNSMASLEEAPFIQGFVLGWGSGTALMYEYYFYPGLTEIEFKNAYNSEKLQYDVNKALYLTQTGKFTLQTLKQYTGNEISDWICKSEERTRRGIFGFTVKKEQGC